MYESVAGTVVEQFLAKSKTRAGTFLDIVNPEEYNPFEAQASQIKYTLDQSRDPLLRELTKVNNRTLQIAFLDHVPVFVAKDSFSSRPRIRCQFVLRSRFYGAQD